MNEIKITIEGLKELTEAIRILAGVKGGQPALMAAQPAQSVPTNQVPTGAAVQQSQFSVAAPQNYSQPPVQPTVPVTMGAQQGAAIPAVPTTAMPQEYTIEQLQVAAAGLSGMGKMPQLMGILQRFGIQAMTELPKERYGEFAVVLREAGAQI